ncbi:hypothetical protein K439DRAFT_1624390 [Ramaria rubella]|nr:hypothetical protein K439DRAFT_1624390 [Ramaria rubella]
MPQVSCRFFNCTCPKFEGQPNQREDEPLQCHDCLHVLNWHVTTRQCSDSDSSLPKSKVHKIMTSYQQPSKAAASINNELEDAKKEALEGFHTKPRRAKSIKNAAEDGKSVRHVIMMPCGLDSQDDSLNDTSAPTPQSIRRLKNQGLAISTSEKGSLWLQKLLPKPFKYLDTKWGVTEDEFHWVLVKVYRKKSLEKQGKNPNGDDLLEAIGDSGMAWNKQKVVVVSRYVIPKKITVSFEGKEHADESEDSSEDGNRKVDKCMCVVWQIQVEPELNMQLAASVSVFGSKDMDQEAGPPVSGPSTITTRATTATREITPEEEDWIACFDKELRACNHSFKSPSQAANNPWDYTPETRSKPLSIRSDNGDASS